MSFLVTAPEILAAAATDLDGIGAAIGAANAAAAAPTTAVLAAGADEISAAMASLFTAHAQAYQGLSVQVGAFHNQFVQALTGAGGAYAAAEAANVSPLQAAAQDMLTAIRPPAQALLGRPLVGNGAHGAPGQAGGDGGLLYGNGGNGGTSTTAGVAGGAGGWLFGNGGAGGAPAATEDSTTTATEVWPGPAATEDAVAPGAAPGYGAPEAPADRAVRAAPASTATPPSPTASIR